MPASLWILSIWCWHDRHKTFLYFIARDVVWGCSAQVHWLCHRRLVLILSNSQMLPFFYYFSPFSLCFASLIFFIVFFLSRFFHHNDSHSCLRPRRHHHHLFTFTIYWLYWIRLVFESFWLSHLCPGHNVMLFQCALYSYSRLYFSFFCSHFFSSFTSLFLPLNLRSFERLSCFTRSVNVVVMLFAFNSYHLIVSAILCASINERAYNLNEQQRTAYTLCETIIAFNNTFECH